MEMAWPSTFRALPQCDQSPGEQTLFTREKLSGEIRAKLAEELSKYQNDRRDRRPDRVREDDRLDVVPYLASRQLGGRWPL